MAKRNIPVDLFYASYTCDCTYELNSSTNSKYEPAFELFLHRRFQLRQYGIDALRPRTGQLLDKDLRKHRR